jgi:hypothetical protein
MPKSMKLAFTCHLLGALLLSVFGLVYLFRPEFMPYHADAVALGWSEVEPSFQVLILALMRVVGGAWLAAAMAIVILLFFPFRRGEKWACWAIIIVGMCASVPSLYATVYVTQNTPATAPWAVASVGILLFIVGFALSLGASKNKESVRNEIASDVSRQ